MTTPHEMFFKEKLIDLCTSSQSVLDIGEGLRARKTSGNRYDPTHAWMQEYITAVDYQVMDPVPDYKPDIIGDIHNIPLQDASFDAIICLAVLEHVENPILAMKEMHRVLKPGGKLLLYVPFLYYYHAFPGYYGDYWRFTFDTLEMFGKSFSAREHCPVRGRIETLTHLTPVGRNPIVVSLSVWLDRLFSKPDTRQVSGYYSYFVK